MDTADPYFIAKQDAGKADPTLVPPRAILAVAEVMQAVLDTGKYKRDSWRTVPDGVRRYRAALMRHLLAILSGEEYDAESGLPHIWHLACNALFLVELRVDEAP